MKKFLKLLLIVLVCIFLTGCGKKTTLECSSNSKQTNYEINTNYTIKAKKDIVNEVKIKQVIKSKDKKILENFEKQLKKQYQLNKKIYGGYTYELKIKGKELIADVTINYEELNMKKFVKNNGAMKDYLNKDNQFTLEGAKKLYKSTGAKCE